MSAISIIASKVCSRSADVVSLPVTMWSLTVQVSGVTFRWGCNKQLRDALCDFAGDSRHDNAWAADLYNRAIARGHDHPDAVRILARAWAGVIWRCWQDNLSYDPSQHRALQSILAQANDEAA